MAAFQLKHYIVVVDDRAIEYWTLVAGIIVHGGRSTRYTLLYINRLFSLFLMQYRFVYTA